MPYKLNNLFKEDIGEYEDYDKREEDWVSETNGGYPNFYHLGDEIPQRNLLGMGETYFSFKYKGLTQITLFRSYHGYHAQMVGPH